MGDEAAEELFTLAALTGIEHTKIVVCPLDFRSGADCHIENVAWAPDLYAMLRAELNSFPKSHEPVLPR